MKRSKLLLFLLLLAVSGFSQIQHIKIVSFTVKNQLPATIDNWNSIPGSLLLVAQKAPTVRLEGVRLVLQIKANGAIICGNNVATGLPVDNFTTRTFNASELTGILSGCHDLKEGNYMLCAQFFNIDKVSISDEVCKPFIVESPKEIDYAPPTLITPENGKSFTEAELQRPVMFRWTSLVPKPKEPVTYRLRVWQLMQGQNGTQAIRSNTPVISKDIDNITQAVVTGIITGPCRPPYLCDFIWTVQAVNRERKPIGRNEGTSEPFTFSVKENETQATIKNVFPEDKKQFMPDEAKQSISFRWTAVVPKPQEPVSYRLKVWQLMQGQNGTQAMRSNQPIVTKDVDNITQVVIDNIYNGPCKPPYLCDFIWVVEAGTRNAAGTEPKIIASSEPTEFNVKTTNEIRPPVNVYPEDKKTIGLDEAKRSITFKWKPVSPNQNGITYKLRVWQLMQGQTSAAAIKNNQPLATLDVDGNGTVDALTDGLLMRLITGPCKPPYLCDFVWNVQAVNKEGHPVGSNEGTSEPTTFAVSQYIIQLDSIKVSCTAKPGVYSFSYTITNPNAGTAKLSNFVVTSSAPAGASITSFAPPLNTNIAPNAQLTITGTVTGSPSLNNICIGAEITDLVNTFWKAAKDTCINVAPCKCTACDSVKIDIVQKDIKFDANGQINLTTNITISPKTVKSIRAELVYFEYKPENDDCMVCNKDSKTFGNFDNGTLANTPGAGGGTHSLDWSFSPPKNFGGGYPASMLITVPPTVKCCDATIRWCIRYVATFADCTVCNKLVCYEKKKEGCAKGNPNPNDPK